MHVLIAEDDESSRDLLAKQIQRLGHTVTATDDGQEAWRAFLTEGPPVVITDWKMPVMDGLDLCRRIREYPGPRYTYILMLTALSGRESYLTGMDAGADDFVTKPVDREELRVRLRVAERILGLRAEVRQLEEMLAICAECKKIRDEDRGWVSVEQYLWQQMGTPLTHGLCPQCYQQAREELRRWQAAHSE